MTTLYTLADNYKRLMDYANDTLDNDDNVDEDKIQMLIDSLDAIQDTIENKVHNIGMFLTNISGDIAALKAEEARLSKKRKALENKQEGLKEYTKQMLELANIDKVKTSLFNVRLQKNNPSVFILDESKIPQTFKLPQPDKILATDILKALKDGQIVDGADFAPEKKHIRFN